MTTFEFFFGESPDLINFRMVLERLPGIIVLLNPCVLVNVQDDARDSILPCPVLPWPLAASLNHRITDMIHLKTQVASFMLARLSAKRHTASSFGIHVGLYHPNSAYGTTLDPPLKLPPGPTGTAIDNQS